MVVVLDQGETIRGVIEWYDKNCIKVHRTNEPNLLVMKSCIRFMYKDGESRNGGNHEAENHQTRKQIKESPARRLASNLPPRRRSRRLL